MTPKIAAMMVVLRLNRLYLLQKDKTIFLKSKFLGVILYFIR